MTWKRSVCILIFAAILCSACGRDYSGIKIENERDISEVIRSSMIRRAGGVTISFDAYTLDRSRIAETADRLVEGALYESSDPTGGDYMRFQYGGYRLTHSAQKGVFKYHYLLSIKPEYYSTAEEEEQVSKRVEEVIESLRLAEDASEYDRAKAVYDYICENVNYDTVHRHTHGSGHVQSTAYGALFYKTALCQGYSVLCYRLLKELGVDNRIITGMANAGKTPERHAWNIVKIGDRYFNLDVTLGDVNESYDYFLKSDADLPGNHVRDDIYNDELFITAYPMGKESL